MTKSRRKAVKYFDQLSEAGMFSAFAPTGWFVEQRYGLSTRQFVEISDQSGRIDWVSMTSTMTTLHRVLKAQEWSSGGIPFDLASGMCLFGAGSDWVVTSNKRRFSAVDVGASQDSMSGAIVDSETIVDVGCTPVFSFYELEKAMRLAEWGLRLSAGASNLLRQFRLITPRVQYFLYFAEVYALGRIEPDAFLKWTRLVAHREQCVGDFFESLLGTSLARPRASPLAEVEGYILEQIRQGAPLDLEAIRRRLTASSRSWANVLTVSPVKTWKQLINLSYVVAFSHQAEVSAREGSCLIHNDDPLEYVILSEAARLDRAKRSQGIATYPWVGVYVPQRVVESDPQLDSSLYDYRPERRDFELLDLHYPISKSSRSARDALTQAMKLHGISVRRLIAAD